MPYDMSLPCTELPFSKERHTAATDFPVVRNARGLFFFLIRAARMVSNDDDLA
jgi:hypothetical protein